MNKFKVGDVVEVVEKIRKRDLPVGTITSISRITDNDDEPYDPTIYLSHDKDQCNWYSMDQIKIHFSNSSPLVRALR